MLKKDTLLFVDDNAKTLELMARIISSENFKVITKTNGEEGLKHIKENDLVSVVISGFNMRGMNGVEFLQQVKALSPITKRCLCSGSFDITTLKTKVKSQEIHGFMIKPVNFVKVLTAINTFMEDREKGLDKFTLQLASI